MILLWMFLALLMERVAVKIGSSFYGTPYAGIGAIDGVLSREAAAPMAYRVLVPWIVGALERVWPGLQAQRLVALYEPLKIALTGTTLWVLSRTLGVRSALFVAAALPATFLFDYWDWTGEMIGLALALGARDVRWVMAGGVVAALSRPETAILVPIAYWLRTRDSRATLWIAGAVFCAMALVRAWAGHKTLYCQRWMVDVNWRDLATVMNNRPFYVGEIVVSALVSAMTLWAVLSGRAGPTWLVPAALLVAGWTMARAAETRVFASCLLWISFLVQEV